MDPNITETLQTLTEHIANLDSLMTYSQEIATNTHFEFFGNSFGEGVVKVAGLIATLLTIAGIGGLGIFFYNRKYNKSCQTKIILDLIRHFYVNNSIAEAVYFNMRDHLHDMHPEGGVFDRFSVLESDLDFGRFNITSKNYEVIHRCNLKMRNYNIMSKKAEQYFMDQNCSDEIKKDALIDLVSRGNGLTNDLLKIAKNLELKISHKGIYHFIDSYTKNKVIEAQSNQKYDDEFDPSINNELRQHYKVSALHWEDRECFNDMVRTKMSTIKFYKF